VGLDAGFLGPAAFLVAFFALAGEAAAGAGAAAGAAVSAMSRESARAVEGIRTASERKFGHARKRW
jgi:hypothetical protein